MVHIPQLTSKEHTDVYPFRHHARYGVFFSSFLQRKHFRMMYGR